MQRRILEDPPEGCQIYPRVPEARARKYFRPHKSHDEKPPLQTQTDGPRLSTCLGRVSDPLGVVFDTSVLVDVFAHENPMLGFSGQGERVRETGRWANLAWRLATLPGTEGHFVVISDYILNELRSVLCGRKRCQRKVRDYKARVDLFLREVADKTVKVVPCVIPHQKFGCDDDDDLPIIGTALSVRGETEFPTRVGALVSSDHHILGVERIPGLKIFDPKTFCNYHDGLIKRRPLHSILGCPIEDAPHPLSQR